MAGSKSKSKSKSFNLNVSDIEKELQGINLEIVKQQLASIQQQFEFQQQQFATAGTALGQQQQLGEIEAGLFTPEQQRERLLQQIARQDAQAAAGDEILQAELDRIRQGPGATDEQKALINEATEAQIRSGESDILSFGQDALNLITEELAPSRGLRPSDTPIQDRGFKLGGELARQQGQLVSGLRGAQAQAELNFPLAANASQAALGQFQQQLGQSGAQFNQQLQQQAFQNRLNLFGQAGQQGLGTASLTADSNLQQAFKPQIGTQGKSKSAGGGISSKTMKSNKRPLDEAAVLEALMQVPVEKWIYKFPTVGEHGDRIGPYAEDFYAAFGVGDGRTIQYMDAIGVLMASVQALTARVKELENGD